MSVIYTLNQSHGKTYKSPYKQVIMLTALPIHGDIHTYIQPCTHKSSCGVCVGMYTFLHRSRVRRVMYTSRVQIVCVISIGVSLVPPRVHVRFRLGSVCAFFGFDRWYTYTTLHHC